MVERLVLIRTIDSLWVEHLTELDDMRRGIGLRGYAQQDPLNEFRREAFALYEELRDLIRHGVATSIFRVTVTRQPTPSTDGADPAVGAALARGAAALSSGNGSNGRGPGGGVGVGSGARTAGAVAAGARTGAGVAATAVPAGASVGSDSSTSVGGSAILRGGPAALPANRVMRESLGDQPGRRRRGGAGSASGAAPGGARPGYTPSGDRIGRNDPCWCGSGAKYKKCHGR